MENGDTISSVIFNNKLLYLQSLVVAIPPPKKKRKRKERKKERKTRKSRTRNHASFETTLSKNYVLVAQKSDWT
jgi:hypothetical protein